jgi:predicted nuclease of restriction endonuclease-like RecB superfamily
MAFKTGDFKKTTRKAGGVRRVYPYQIRDDRYTAAIGYAIAYYERMVGRRRAEFEADTLLEFFGDPRLARGLVACLAQTYVWREQRFEEALGPEAAGALRRAGIDSPADARARLYGLANGRYGGVILPGERAGALAFLCERIAEAGGERGAVDGGPTTADHPPTESTPHASRLPPPAFERALTLDAEDQRVLVKLGPTPTADEIVARYNYHSLETAICHAEIVRLRLRGPVWSIVRSAHNLARRHRVRYSLGSGPRTLFDDRLDLALLGARDALGGWTRAGRRLARVLLRLIAAHPGALAGGEALVHIGGQPATLYLDEPALAVLGAAAQREPPDSQAWDADIAEQFFRAWGRAYAAGRTAGWRLRRDPEPLIGQEALVMPDFALLRGGQRLALCLAPGRAAAEELTRSLARLGQRAEAVLLAPDHVAEALPTCPSPLVSYADQPGEAIGALVALLERRHPRSRGAPAHTPWQVLERLVAEEGFVPEAEVAALLQCPPAEAARMVARWGGAALHALPGVGVCSPDALDDIRQMLGQGALAPRAA